jgi:hypothetical protein
MTMLMASLLDGVEATFPPVRCRYVGPTLACRLQLCGAFAVRVGGRRVEGALPGRHGRALLGYLALHRDRSADRDELVEALWPAGAPAAPDASLRALVSRLRSALGAELLQGRGELRLVLPPGSPLERVLTLTEVHSVAPIHDSLDSALSG